MARSDLPSATSAPTSTSTASATSVRLRHFSRSLPMMLLRAREAVMRHFRTSLRRFNITEQQWRVLRALSDGAETEVADLADATYLLGPSLSRILRDLEKRDLVKRRLDPADGRRNLLRISSCGTDLIDKVSPQSEVIYGEITERFGVQKLATLQELLRDLEIAMGDELVAAADEDAVSEQA